MRRPSPAGLRAGEGEPAGVPVSSGQHVRSSGGSPGCWASHRRVRDLSKRVLLRRCLILRVSVVQIPVCNRRWKRDTPLIIPKYRCISKQLGFCSRCKIRVEAGTEKACCWSFFIQSCYLPLSSSERKSKNDIWFRLQK